MKNLSETSIPSALFKPNIQNIVLTNFSGHDHHAIIPTMTINKAILSEIPAGELNILNMLAVRLICATASTHSFEAVTAVLECSGNRFTAKGRTILDDGWKAVDRAFRATLKNKPDEDGEENSIALPLIKDGQVFRSVTSSVKEGKTSPPRRHTEDTLLSAMGTAGAEDMPEDAERKGLGTPATRAAVIEKLINSGFVERQKKNLIPSHKGINLIAVLPDSIKSPLLTAEWEQKLKSVERGELTDSAFMDGIASMTQELIKIHSAPVPEYNSLFASAQSKNASGDSVGFCPRCGGRVVERQKAFFCSNRSCSFALWKDNRFFTSKKKKITKDIAAALLKEGRVFISGLYSEKSGKTYGATVVMEDTGDKFIRFRLDFSNKKQGK